MMKKIVIFLFACVFLALNVHTAYADVLIEPEDSFYRNHADECHSERKYYISEAPVSILSSPNDKRGYSTAPVDSCFYISWIYTDKKGNQWGLYDGVDVSYWVKMDQLVPIYSHEEFMSEHASEIIEESITFNPDQNGYVTLYEYPGSPWISDVLNTEWISEGSFTVHQIYVDEQGQRWGYMPYYRMHNGWINLDDAITENEPQRVAPVIFIPSEKPSSILWISIMVIAVCAITGILYVRKHKK